MATSKSIKQIISNFSNGKYSHAFLVETNNLEKCLEDIKEYIKVINCPYEYSESCSRNCNLCKLINLNNLPSVIIIKPDGMSIKKNQLLEVQEKFNTKPVYSKFNSYIICNAELMNESAANSILKFLEEPEDNIIGFFITENKEQIISTIKSRCEMIKATYSDDKNEDENLVEIATTYLIKVLDDKRLAVNKEYLLPQSLTRAQIEKIFKQIFNTYLSYINGNYFPGNILAVKNNLSLSILKQQLIIITNTLSMIRFNVSIELLLDYFVIEMRKISD